MSINALEGLLKKAKAQDLDEGIHGNCRIVAVDILPRETAKGEPLTRNTFITIVKFNNDNTSKKEAEKEISWFNLKPESEYALDNFREQILQLAGILKCYYTPEEVAAQFKVFEGVKGFETALDDDTELEVNDHIAKAVSNKKIASQMLGNAMGFFFKMMQGKYGYESDLIRVKFTFSKDGQYIQQPGYGVFTESMKVPEDKSTLKMTKTETKYIASARDYSKVGSTVTAGDLTSI